jgi:hypothetical protein
MADNTNEIQKRNLLREISEIQERISEQNKAAATATGEELRQLENRIASEKIRLRLNEESLETIEEILSNEQKLRQEEEKRLQLQEEFNDLQDDFAKSFVKLGNIQKQLLTNSNTSGNSFAAITAKILELKQEEITASDEDRIILQQRREILEGIRSQQVEQAESVASAKENIIGISEAEKRRIEFQTSIIGLTDEEKQLAEQSFAAKENLIMQQERYNQLQEASTDIIGKMPAGIQSVIGGIRTMITGIRAFGVQAAIATGGLTLVIGAIVAGLDYFMELEQAGEDFRKETGITNSMMGDMESKANNIAKTYGTYGISIKDAYDSMTALRDEISEVANYSEAAVAGITVMKTNFGVSAEEAAKVQGVLESVGGLSQDTAVNVQMQVANMAKLANVAPKKVLKDIADNAEAASTFFKGNVTLLVKQAVEARRLGTNLSEVTKTAEKLLDFEGGIEEELVAATFVSGQFNLSRARALAFEGKLVEAQKETLSQIQRSGDFRKKDYFTQQQLAKAAGMSVEEINKQLNVQEKLSKLSKEERERAEQAINAGLDITNINDEQLMQKVQEAAAQKEIASTISNMENTFKGIIASVGGSLLPFIQMWFTSMKPIFFIVKMIAQSIAFIIDGISWILKKLGFGGIVDGISSLYNSMDTFNIPTVASLAGDIISPSNGKTMVSTKEGGLFELSANDDLIAAPGIASKMSGGAGTTESSTILIGPLNALLGEIRGLRTDMNSGKIGVYMDTEKVTSKIGRQVDSSTRNNFNLGQA